MAALMTVVAFEEADAVAASAFGADRRAPPEMAMLSASAAAAIFFVSWLKVNVMMYDSSLLVEVLERLINSA
ncbi:hypothetical protein ACLBWT_08040 [Paenibacillus sp. D51F]